MCNCLEDIRFQKDTGGINLWLRISLPTNDSWLKDPNTHHLPHAYKNADFMWKFFFCFVQLFSWVFARYIL